MCQKAGKQLSWKDWIKSNCWENKLKQKLLRLRFAAKSGKKLFQKFPSGLNCVQQRVEHQRNNCLHPVFAKKKQSNQGLKEAFTTHRSSWPRWPVWTPGSSGFGFRIGGARSIRGSRLRFWSLERSENPMNMFACLHLHKQTNSKEITLRAASSHLQ